MKNGAPIIEVIIPTGISVGAKISRPTVSEHKSRNAPTRALLGIRNLWSLPSNMRAIWGAIKQTNPIIPVKAMIAEVANADNIRVVPRERLAFTPKLIATSSPKLKTLMFHD